MSEVRAISEFAHAHGLLVHMDGARISNAAASLGVSLRELTVDSGVDALSFGGTKNGLMGGEAIVFFKPELATSFKFIRKQGMQLTSKMRFVSAQFQALLSNDLWLKNAAHANAMAKLLETEIKTIPGLTITQKVQTNGVFVSMPASLIERIKSRYFFYTWNAQRSEVRWMCSFDTTEEDVRGFAAFIRDCARGVSV
jgi:threonine aldolase